jgi:hypothetical protein
MGPKGKFLRFLFRSGLFDSYISRLHAIVEEHVYERNSSSAAVYNAKAISQLLGVFDPVGKDFIRLGNEHDGGYVIVDTITYLDAVLSLGVGSDISFEEALSAHVKRIDLYDHTVLQPPITIKNSTFYRLGISGEPRPEFVTLSQAVDTFRASDNILLKMDIEHSEWAVLAGASSITLNRFQQVVVEFHGLLELIKPECAREMIEALRRINETHRLVHLHVNNYEPIAFVGGVAVPNVLEATYLRKTEADFIQIPRPRGLCLNRPNNPNKLDVSTEINF